jgi:hypothetical protein
MDPGPNPSSDTAIWRRIFQSSYIREQYVLTHCSASPEPGPGSTCSSESPGSQGPGSPSGSRPLDPPSQQGCRSLAWVEPAGSRSCPLPVPPPSPFKVRFHPSCNHHIYIYICICIYDWMVTYIYIYDVTTSNEHRTVVLWALSQNDCQTELGK